MNAPRWLLPAAVAGLAVGHAGLSVAPALVRIRNDFANYYVPARTVLRGEPLDRAYERPWFPRAAARAGLPRLGSLVPHPPANALLLLPLAKLPPLPAKAAWTLVLTLCGVFSFLLLRSRLPLSAWLLALVFLLPTSSWSNALLYGQPYPLLLLLLCLSLALLMADRDAAAGLALAPVVVLKLYGLPFLVFFIWTRRWRAALGMAAGVLALCVLTVAVLGGPVHRAYLREVLPASLAGDVQDPYSPIWGSVSSLAHRLFQGEPDLNPRPALEAPVLAFALSRAVPAALLVLAVLAAGRARGDRALPEAYAVLALGSLAASPLTGSYHFVLLVLPLAVFLAGRPAPALGAAALALFVFATSPAPHYFFRWASGWTNPLAYPRLVALVALLALALAPLARRRDLVLAAVAGAVVFAWSAARSSRRIEDEEPWRPLREAAGYLSADPIVCGGRLSWVTIAGDSVVRREAGGSDRPEPLPGLRCRDGQLVPATDSPDVWEPADADQRSAGGETVRVLVDRVSGELREEDAGGLRTLDRGTLRHPRLSPDGDWIVYQAWDGSWDLVAVHRPDGRRVRITADPANELEPSWSASGHEVVFASDRRRGLGSTALFAVPFAP